MTVAIFAVTAVLAAAVLAALAWAAIRRGRRIYGESILADREMELAVESKREADLDAEVDDEQSRIASERAVHDAVDAARLEAETNAGSLSDAVDSIVGPRW